MANNEPTTGAQKAVKKINAELNKRGINDSIAYTNSKGKVVGSNQGDYTVLKGSNRGIAVTARNTPIKSHSTDGGVLGGAHMGGHSDVSTAINLGGFTVKTPIVKPSSTKNK